MMPTIILAAVACMSAIVTATVPLWRSRRDSPESLAVVLTGSASYLAEVHQRLSELESRVLYLERENRAYFNLHGALPEHEDWRRR